MHPTQFTKIVEHRLAACHHVLAVKGAEYSKHNDRLHNFKSAAAMDGTTPARSLWGMWKKHIVSIKDIIDDLDAGTVPSPEMVHEKLGDNINYTLLLEGLIEELRDLWSHRVAAGVVAQSGIAAVAVDPLVAPQQDLETFLMPGHAGGFIPKLSDDPPVAQEALGRLARRSPHQPEQCDD